MPEKISLIAFINAISSSDAIDSISKLNILFYVIIFIKDSNTFLYKEYSLLFIIIKHPGNLLLLIISLYNIISIWAKPSGRYHVPAINKCLVFLIWDIDISFIHIAYLFKRGLE